MVAISNVLCVCLVLCSVRACVTMCVGAAPSHIKIGRCAGIKNFRSTAAGAGRSWPRGPSNHGGTYHGDHLRQKTQEQTSNHIKKKVSLGHLWPCFFSLQIAVLEKNVTSHWLIVCHGALFPKNNEYNNQKIFQLIRQLTNIPNITTKIFQVVRNITNIKTKNLPKDPK